MKNTKKIIEKAADELLREGIQLLANHTSIKIIGNVVETEEKPASLHGAYNDWYTKALPLIRSIASDRIDDFISHYKNLKPRKQIDFDNYTISDYLQQVPLRGYKGINYDAFSLRLNNQVTIVKGVLTRLDSVLADMEGLLQADLFDSEIDTARELLKKKHLRSAGVIAGVVLEKHLKKVAAHHAIKMSKAKPVLADLNEALKSSDIYDIPTWRKIQSLGDIRNLCAHGTAREPTEEEIEDLIIGVDRAIKNIF